MDSEDGEGGYRPSPYPISSLPSVRHSKPAPKSVEAFDLGPCEDQPGPGQQAQLCAVCKRNTSRYACPKCNAPYCCVTCYRAHGELCTEAFYRSHRTCSLAGRHANDLRGVLARLNSDVNDNLDNVENREESLSNMVKNGAVGLLSSDLTEFRSNNNSMIIGNGNNSQISDEDLAELASYVLQNDVSEGDDSEDLLRTIPPHLLYAFERALIAADSSERSIDDCQGGLENTCVPFAPKVNDVPDGVCEERNTRTKWWLQDDEHLSAGLSLDERILSIPNLCSRATPPNIALRYNILEVLFATALVIRASCNAKETARDDDIVDEIALLLSQSQVLSSDRRYTSVDEVLSSCSEHFVTMKKTMPHSMLNVISPADDGDRVISWEKLATDVTEISSNRRFVLRMLFDAKDICRGGLSFVKTQLKETGSAQSHEELEGSKRIIKLAAKKIEYFLSWISRFWTPESAQHISEEVKSFVRDWKPDVRRESSALETLIGGICIGGDELAEAPGADLLTIGEDAPDIQLISVSTTRRKRD